MAKRRSCILHELFHERKSGAFTVGLLCLLDAAEFDQGVAAGLVWGHAGAEVIVHVEL
jgi:hypothetical protein